MERQVDSEKQGQKYLEQQSQLREKLKQTRMFVQQGRLDSSILERIQAEYSDFLSGAKTKQVESPETEKQQERPDLSILGEIGRKRLVRTLPSNPEDAISYEEWARNIWDKQLLLKEAIRRINRSRRIEIDSALAEKGFSIESIEKGRQHLFYLAYPGIEQTAVPSAETTSPKPPEEEVKQKPPEIPYLTEDIQIIWNEVSSLDPLQHPERWTIQDLMTVFHISHASVKKMVETSYLGENRKFHSSLSFTKEEVTLIRYLHRYGNNPSSEQIQHIKETVYEITNHKDSAEEPLKIVAKPEQTTALTVQNIANRIISLMPTSQIRYWTLYGQITPEEYIKQVMEFANYAVEAFEGKIAPVNPLDIVNATPNQKKALAKDKLKEILVPVITNTELPMERIRYRWGRNVRELSDYTGATLPSIIDSLSEVERALFISISSINLLEDLGYLDLEECDEFRFATYIRNASFEPISVRDDNLATLIQTAVERADSGDMNLATLIDTLIEPPYNPVIFERMIESANSLGLRDKLIQIFLTHPTTAYLAKRLSLEMQPGELDETMMVEL